MDSTMSAELRARFDAAGQGHVFKFVDQGLLTPPQEESFLKQLDGLDLTYISQSYAAAMADAASGAATADISPPDAFTSLTDCTPEAVIDWENVTLEAIGRGEVAACVLAGGQGTRLGFNGPKGCYNIGLPSAKPLFQLMCERIQRLLHLAKNKGFVDARMPLLVMTSPINDSETRSFFADNNNFGLSEDAVWFFAQGTLPCLTPPMSLLLHQMEMVDFIQLCRTLVPWQGCAKRVASICMYFQSTILCVAQQTQPSLVYALHEELMWATNVCGRRTQRKRLELLPRKVVDPL